MDYWIGFASGIAFALVLSRGYWKGRVKILATQMLSAYIQERKDLHDSGRDHKVRENAGPPAELGSLFEIHPGAMTLSHMEDSQKVDTQPDSTTIGDGSNSDRESY